MNHYQTIGKKGGQLSRGERKGSAKLTEQSVREILTSAEPFQTLGLRYGVHPKHIASLKRREWWKHVGHL